MQTCEHNESIKENTRVVLPGHSPRPCSVSVCHDVTYEILGLSQMSTHPRWAKSISQFFKRWTVLLTCCGRHPWSVLDFKDMLWMMCRIQLCFVFFFLNKYIPGAGILAQWVKPSASMPASHMAPVHILVTPLPFQVLAKGLGKATEGDP